MTLAPNLHGTISGLTCLQAILDGTLVPGVRSGCAFPGGQKSLFNESWPVPFEGAHLIESRQYDEAEKMLRRAVELAPADYMLPATSLPGV